MFSLDDIPSSLWVSSMAWWLARSRRLVVLALMVGFLVVLGLLAAPLATEGQQAGKVYRIGMLEIVPESASAANLRAFRQGLRELGYVEGHHFAIEYRSADGRAERLFELASELVRLEVDVIVTSGTPAALVAKGATRRIPIVMAWSGNPVAEGVVASLARPGGNVTGLHVLPPAEIGGRQLHFLREMVPGLSRVGVLWNPPTHARLLVRETEKVARVMGVQLQSFEVWGPEGLERTFEAVVLSRVDALITVEDYLTFDHRTQIVELAAMSKLPAIHGLREFAEAGGLMAYGTDRRDLFRRSATYVHKIFKGASPADLPVEHPTKFELVINRKTAKALGLTIPPSLLLRADQVIE